jgi:hypothetical protein
MSVVVEEKRGNSMGDRLHAHQGASVPRRARFESRREVVAHASIRVGAGRKVEASVEFANSLVRDQVARKTRIATEPACGDTRCARIEESVSRTGHR